jgi:protein-tyrosine phosphatase
MLAVTKEMQERVDAGEVLYLHCSGGVGRAGTAAACLYARLTGAEADAVLDHIQTAFDTRGSGALLHTNSLGPYVTCTNVR